ncbi:MAG: hypothetical protein HYU43_02740 [Armatimonadetes bacterium]|nr:hypothetical protein [Armatimonadota bacterium]
MRTVGLLLVVVAALLLTGPRTAATAPRVQLVGAGLIGNPIAGKTINSPSDFGFAVTATGGTFVCSMAGPLTGGFKGLKVMTVEGPVTAGSLKIRGRTASFSGKATVILVPGMDNSAVQILASVPFTVTVSTGGAGKASLTMKVPQFTKVLGGDTGGVVKIGSIRVER